MSRSEGITTLTEPAPPAIMEGRRFMDRAAGQALLAPLLPATAKDVWRQWRVIAQSQPLPADEDLMDVDSRNRGGRVGAGSPD